MDIQSVLREPQLQYPKRDTYKNQEFYWNNPFLTIEHSIYMQITLEKVLQTSFWFQRSLNRTGSPAAVKMVTSSRTSVTLGINPVAEALDTTLCRGRVSWFANFVDRMRVALNWGWRDEIEKVREWDFGKRKDWWTGHCRLQLLGNTDAIDTWLAMR